MMLPQRVGDCCPCRSGELCAAAKVQLRMPCMLACVRRGQQLLMGRTWHAPRLVGTELVMCADKVNANEIVDCAELVVLVQQCFVPADAPDTLLEYVTSLVSCEC